MLTVKGSIIKLVGLFFMSIYIRMPTINFSVTQSIETLAVNLSASEALVMNINNPLIGASYFGLETVPDSNGVYTSTAPKNTSGSLTLGTGILGVVRDDYKMSAVVSPGNNVLTFSPAVAVTGSTLRTRGIGAPPLSTGFDADAQAFFNRVTAAGGTLSATEQIAVNTLVVQMKVDGTWTPMKAIYPMVGASAAACAQNLKSSSFTGTFTSGWTFASTGVTPNGTSAYMNSNLNTNGYSSLHFSYYSRSNNGLGRDMGNTDLVNSALTFDLILSLSGTFYSRFTSNSTISTSIANSTGFFIATEAPTLQHKAFRNNIQLGSAANFNGSYLNMDVWIGAVNGSPVFYGQKECAFSSIGDGLTNTESSNLYTAVQAFQTTLSRQV